MTIKQIKTENFSYGKGSSSKKKQKKSVLSPVPITRKQLIKRLEAGTFSYCSGFISFPSLSYPSSTPPTSVSARLS